MIDFLHKKLGDFWFYSLMIFCAMRAADALNMFVGLWLVPKYVPQDELGAVLPLTTFATAIAIPAYVFAMTFMKELNTLATKKEFGKMKSLMRGVFVGMGLFLFLSILIAKLTMPLFMERMRLVEGSLGFLIIASAFLGCASPVYTNALQGLKKFKAISLMNIIGAPIRLLTMLVAMPFRAISGYFIGQSSVPAFQIFASIFFLRKELSVKAEPYWTKPVFKSFSRLFAGMGLYIIIPMLTGLVEWTILRQRLPSVESGAFYMVTRFSDITGFVSGALLLTLFPFTSELAENGKSTKPLVIKSSLVMLILGFASAILFWIFGEALLGFFPNGEDFASYYWAIPWMAGISTLGSIQAFYTNTEVSAGRFGFLWWYAPFFAFWSILLLLITGFGYFKNIMPEPVFEFLKTHNITSLKALLSFQTVRILITQTIITASIIRQK